MKLHFYTLWAINAPLDERHLCSQLDDMKRWGFDGAVWHPRFYPGVPAYLSDEYLAIVSRIILYAKMIGLEFWLYDEDGWPSGTVGGTLLERYPNDRQQWADLTQQEPANPADNLGAFEYEGQTWYLARRFGEGVDYLNPHLARHFLEMTYERYRIGLDPAAFDHVTTFFCDEPEFGLGHAYDLLSPFGAIPWTPRLPEIYASKYSEEISTILPLLFFPGEGHAAARVRFWEMLTDLFGDAFLTPIDNWCKSHGKRFTAHIKGEEHPLFQVPMVGSSHQILQRVALPGIDALERDPSGHFFPRQVASVAQQFGNGDCMVEAFGGAGWGSSPEDLERYLKWLAGHGLNHFVIHLYQSRLTTHAIHDWPSSTPAHVTWRDAYPQLLCRTRDFASNPPATADTLVVAPYRGIMEAYEPRELLATNIHNASTYPDTPAGRLNRAFLQLLDEVHESGVAYHVCDERTVEESGRVEDGKLRIGKCVYGAILLAEGTRFGAAATRTLLSGLNVNAQLPALPVPCCEPIAPTDSQNVATTESIKWKKRDNVVNTFVIEAETVDTSTFKACFEASAEVAIGVDFLDEVSQIRFNKAAVSDDRTVVTNVGLNEICFEAANLGLTPLVSIWGRFLVKSETPYHTGPNNTVETDGPFQLSAETSVDYAYLVEAGYPFCCLPVVVSGTLPLIDNIAKLTLSDICASCARVWIGGIDAGYCWAPDWSVPIPATIATGEYVITVELIPSPFNFYGPHHHIDGDPHVVSPIQYEYSKNFADRPDAPENTRTFTWHFKPFGIGAKNQ